MRHFFVILFLSFYSHAFAQSTERYLFPVKPGQLASLAGNMGELRSNHFHTGIDIRTNNQIGWPIHAAKSGYISRAAMSSSGYGNVLYVTHPDGNTTLYAHLESFSGAVADYVRQEQYRRKVFEIDLYFRKNQFPVKQGDTLALSGNTGSSSGPHLHFDIRDKDNQALDPLSFAFPEVVDVSHPYAEKIALRTFDQDGRINDRFGRTEFYVLRNGGTYSLPYPILAYGKVGIELLAKDRLAAGSPYYGGVNFIEVHANNRLLFRQSIEKLDLAQGRSINALLSFRSLRGNNSKFYKLYVDDGNTLPFYNGGTGKFTVAAGDTVAVRINMKDVFGNASTMSFTLKGAVPDSTLLFDNSQAAGITATTWDNTLALQASVPLDSNASARVYSQGREQTIRASYGGKFTSTYLVNMSYAIPDSIRVGNRLLETFIKAKVPSGNAYTYYGTEADVHFPKGALYDTLYFQVTAKADCDQRFISLGDPLVPLHRFIGVTWRLPDFQAWDPTWGVYRKNGTLSFVGGTYANGSVQFNIREFGTYTLVRDTLAPEVKPQLINSAGVVVKISDELSGIESYEASVNNQWLLMHYDAKTGTLRSERLDKSKPLAGPLVVTVTDRCGNKATLTQLIE